MRKMYISTAVEQTFHYSYKNNSDGYNAIMKFRVRDSKEFKKDYKNLCDFYLKEIEMRCGCSHDCCGHWFTMLNDVKRNGKRITMKVSTARNY